MHWKKELGQADYNKYWEAEVAFKEVLDRIAKEHPGVLEEYFAAEIRKDQAWADFLKK